MTNATSPACPVVPNAPHYGLTKREVFAMHAMQGYLANPDLSGEANETYAEWSVNTADAVLRELDKQ